MKQTYVFISDPGHGWLEVPKSDIEEAGCRHMISHCSYEKGSTAYLEEDCDCPIFLKARKLSGHAEPLIMETHVNRDSDIRRFEPFFSPTSIPFADRMKWLYAEEVPA